jgi:hypothetical protein
LVRDVEAPVTSSNESKQSGVNFAISFTFITIRRACMDLFALPRVAVGRHDETARLRLRMIGL